MSPTPGSCPMDLNRGGIFEDTSGVRPSAPLHVGAYSRADEREKLRSCYSLFHGFKPQMNTGTVYIRTVNYLHAIWSCKNGDIKNLFSDLSNFKK